MIGLSFSILLPLLLRTGGNELLDYVQTKAYWKSKGVAVTVEAMTAQLAPAPKADDQGQGIAVLIKQLGDDDYDVRERAQKKLVAIGAPVRAPIAEATRSDDPEVAHRAREIQQALAPRGPARPMAQTVRRLMAIRTLGELKDPKAVPVLQAQVKAAEPFVADYARRALATIQGKPSPRRAPAPDASTDDVWRLPAGCALVGQLRLPARQPKPLDKLLADAGDLPGGMDKEKLVAKVNDFVLSIAERIGNVRVDTITVGVSGRFERREGFVVVMARGLCDADAVKAAMRVASPNVASRRIGAVEMFSPDGDVAILVASDRRIALVTGPSRRNLPVEAVAHALSTGRGDLRNEAELAKLIRSVDRTKPLWAVGKLTETYRQLPVLAPFDTATLVGTRQADRLDLALAAHGTDPEPVKRAVAGVEKGVAELLAALRNGNVPRMLAKPMIALLGSVKVRADGATAHATARLTGSPIALALPMLMSTRVRTARARPGPPRGRVAKTSGTVTWMGKPIPYGSITLVPDRNKGNKGRAATGVIKKGNFTLTTYEKGDGALVGWHRIELSYPKGDPMKTRKMRMEAVVLGDHLPAIYRGMKTVLTVKIKAGAQNILKFDLPRKQDKKRLRKGR